jgi:hypothetical protein
MVTTARRRAAAVLPCSSRCLALARATTPVSIPSFDTSAFFHPIEMGLPWSIAPVLPGALASLWRLRACRRQTAEAV